MRRLVAGLTAAALIATPGFAQPVQPPGSTSGGGSLSATASANPAAGYTEGQAGAGLYTDLPGRLWTHDFSDALFGSVYGHYASLVDLSGTPVSFADQRATGQTLAGTLATTAKVVVNNGSGIVRGHLAGFSGGGVVTFEVDNNDGAGSPTWMTATLFVAGLGQVSGATMSADGDFAFDLSGRTAWRMRVSTANSGSLTYDYNVTSAAAPYASVDGRGPAQQAVVENPLVLGCRSATATPTLSTDGQRQYVLCGPKGEIIMRPWALKENSFAGAAATTGTTATTFTGWTQPIGGLFAYILSVHCGRDDTGTTPIWVTLNDTNSTPVLLPAAGANNPRFELPLKVTAANTTPTFTPSASTASGTKGVACDAQGFNAP